MDSFGSDDERASPTLDNGNMSDADEDEPMDDADADGDADMDDDNADNDDDNDDDADGDDDDDQDQDQDEDPDADADAEADDDDAPDEPGAPPPHRSRSTTAQPTGRPLPTPRPGADTAQTYDIVPYVAAPQSTSINAFCATPCMKWTFTGGSDGYIRKFDWFAGMNGKVPLTVAQKHPFVDSVTRAGVLLSYWENEETGEAGGGAGEGTTGGGEGGIRLSPVYSLAVQREALWLLSGLESGAINLQMVRHEEGRIVTTLRGHTQAVSVLKLDDTEASLLSGSWDSTVAEWDLHTGQIARSYTGSAGQISSIQFRPSHPATAWADIRQQTNGDGGVNGNNAASPAESARSFGSLFGDDDEDDAMGGTGAQDSQEQKPATPPPPPPPQHGSQSVFMTSHIDGTIRLHDRRQPNPVAVSTPQKGVPPWCMSAIFSTDGNTIFAGRRNGTVDEYSLHHGLHTPVRSLKFPAGSGSVSALCAMPNGRHIITASYDNLRLWDLNMVGESEKRVPFLIVPGHHGGVVSEVYVDRSCRYLVSLAGNRGWEGSNTEVWLGYEINF